VAYQAVAGLYDPDTGARWGETALALSVHVVARSSPVGAKMAPAGVRFQEGIELVSYELDRERGEIALTLYWRAAQLSSRVCQVFVHLLDAGGGAASRPPGAVRVVGVNLGCSTGRPEVSGDAVLLALPPAGAP